VVAVKWSDVVGATAPTAAAILAGAKAMVEQYGFRERLVSPSEFRRIARSEANRLGWSRKRMRKWIRRNYNLRGKPLGALDPWMTCAARERRAH
jgi:hypothetical protein